MSSASIGGIVRGGFWLYLNSIVNSLGGFFYWMVISAISGPGVVGVVSAVVGFSSMVAGLLSLNISVGVQRFYGRAIGLGDRVELSRCFWSALLYMLVVCGSSFIVIASLSLLGVEIFGLSPLMLLLSGVFVLLSINNVVYSLIASFLRTDVMFLASIAGNALKFVVGVGLVVCGWGWVGAAIGCMCPSIAGFAIAFPFSLRYVIKRPMFSLSSLRDSLVAGLASWIPEVISLLGSLLGVLTVFGFAGAVETGFYYVAYAIAGVVTMVGAGMASLLLPVLSSMSDARKRATSRVLRIGSVFMVPLTVFLMAYPSLPLSLLGREYVAASPALFTILLSSLPAVVAGCVSNLVYAYGMYRLVLAIGLATNTPRIALYYMLIPSLGSLGATISFTVGSFSGLMAAVLVAYRVGFQIDFKNLLIATSIPAIPATLCHLLSIPWIASSFLILGSCIIGYPMLRVISRSDLHEISSAILNIEKVNRLYHMLKPLIDLLLRD